MGLLGDFAIGAGASAAKAGADLSYDKIKADIEEAKRARLMEMESRIQEDRDRAKEERAKESKRSDSEALRAEVDTRMAGREAGLLNSKYAGSNVGAEDMAALPPEARAIYEKDVGAPSEADRWKMQRDAALSLDQAGAANTAQTIYRDEQGRIDKAESDKTAERRHQENLTDNRNARAENDAVQALQLEALKGTAAEKKAQSDWIAKLEAAKPGSPEEAELRRTGTIRGYIKQSEDYETITKKTFDEQGNNTGQSEYKQKRTPTAESNDAAMRAGLAALKAEKAAKAAKGKAGNAATPAPLTQTRMIEDINREITILHNEMKNYFGADTPANKAKMAALLAEKKAIPMRGR